MSEMPAGTLVDKAEMVPLHVKPATSSKWPGQRYPANWMGEKVDNIGEIGHPHSNVTAIREATGLGPPSCRVLPRTQSKMDSGTLASGC